MHLLIVGGSDAGIGAGLRAREVDRTADVTVLVADSSPNYSICGIPYHISGDVPDWRRLAHRTGEELGSAGLDVRRRWSARTLWPAEKCVEVTDSNGRDRTVPYDRLVIGTGARPVRPPIPGLASLGSGDGVHLLHTMADTFAVMRTLDQRRPDRALIVGGGYIGLEMAEALARRGLAVTVVEQLPEVLPTLDPSLGRLVGAELRARGVEVVTGTSVTAVAAGGGATAVDAENGRRWEVGLVLVCVGVRPDSDLAKEAGARPGRAGAVEVDRRMRTSIPDVHAAGDCVHTHHRLLPEPAYLPLGTTAHKQGRSPARTPPAGTASAPARSAPR